MGKRAEGMEQFTMISGGLVSITFRQLEPKAIVDLVQKSGLDCIEWGGDVHVPHGDLKRAKEVNLMTNEAGLTLSSYGSYYRVAESENEGLAFQSVLDTAQELTAPIIRVWAGRKGSALADGSYRKRVVDDSLRIADLAAPAGIRVAYEYHSDTLTDTNESAIQLLAETDHPNIATFWQPPNGKDMDYCLDGLRTVLPELASIHVFHWHLSEGEINRHPLAEGRARWLKYLHVAKTAHRDHDALIEFVKDNDPEQFLKDAEVLKSWLQYHS